MIIFNGYIVFVGHEATGVVTEIGSDVKNLSVGSRVAVENHFFCEQCYTCKVKLHIIFVGIQFYYDIKSYNSLHTQILCITGGAR